MHSRQLDLTSPDDDDTKVDKRQPFDDCPSGGNSDEDIDDDICQLYGLDHYDSDDDNQGVC